MRKLLGMVLFSVLTASVQAQSWEAEVTSILQHGSVVAIYLDPDPGIGQCQYGSPYILVADGSPESNQRFSMLLTALTTGKKIDGWEDTCSSYLGTIATNDSTLDVKKVR